ncbi:MAG: hypothetical protein U0667_04795 [Chloroflexota bacterium]
MVRAILACAVAAIAALCPVPAAGTPVGPIPGASPAPTATPAPGPPYPPPAGDSFAPTGLPWQPVALALREGRWLDGLMAWSQGFAAIERDEDDRAHAVWTSSDGVDWHRSRLRGELQGAWRVVSFRERLYLFTPMERTGSVRLALRVWRSSDGIAWRRSGTFRWSLPRRYDGVWRTAFAEVAATPERLVLFVAIDGCCGSGGGVPAPTRFASVAGGWTTRVPGQGLAIWSSSTGSSWRRGSNEAFRSEQDGGYAWVTDLRQEPDGLLATRQSGSLVRTTDGIAWTTLAGLPDEYVWGGSEGLLEVAGTVMVLSDDDSPGGRSMGNRLGAWLLADDGTWVRTMDIQPGFSSSQVAVGATVIVVGRGWDSWSDWPLLLVSVDGGRTWDPSRSWSGGREGCLGDIVARGSRVVMRDCAGTGTALWVTDVPSPRSPTQD